VFIGTSFAGDDDEGRGDDDPDSNSSSADSFKESVYKYPLESKLLYSFTRSNSLMSS